MSQSCPTFELIDFFDFPQQKSQQNGGSLNLINARGNQSGPSVAGWQDATDGGAHG
jgi:hypothetical protein